MTAQFTTKRLLTPFVWAGVWVVLGVAGLGGVMLPGMLSVGVLFSKGHTLFGLFFFGGSLGGYIFLGDFHRLLLFLLSIYLS